MMKRQEIYCAFCKNKRVVYGKKHISFENIFLSLLFSLVVMVISWQEVDARACIVFLLGLIIAEMFIQIRWRVSIVCKNCGFDPVLYTQNTSQAADRVQEHLDLRKQDPDHCFKPPLNLPVIYPKEGYPADRNKD